LSDTVQCSSVLVCRMISML